MKLGIIGAGNMGSTILKAAFKNNYVNAYETNVFDINQEAILKLTDVYPIQVMQSAARCVIESECIILAVKPQFMKGVMDEIVRHAKNKRFISIAAGWTTAMLQEGLNAKESNPQILRVMPNTPSLVGAGYSAFSEENTFNSLALNWAKGLFDCLGKVQMVPEKLFDAVVAVSGSSPAYVYMFIEAMADAAVKLGMPRKMALQAAAQAVFGSAKMVLESNDHVAKLKDDVCSPGGTTIEAVQVLEENCFRGTVMKAMEACAKKNHAMATAYERRQNDR